MIKFFGKPHELRLLLKKMCNYYGKDQKAVLVYIMLQKEYELLNEEI